MDAQLIANNPREEVLIKIRSLQMQNATSAQLENIKKIEVSAYRHFLVLVRDVYGFNCKQLLEFSDDHIEALAEVLYYKVKARAIIGGTLAWTFGLLIPGIGWLMILGPFLSDEVVAHSYHYRRRCNQLRKILGDKYLSAKRFREINS